MAARPKEFNTPYYKEIDGRVPQAMTDYFDYSEKIIREKDISMKLWYCHCQLKLLPFFTWDYLHDLEDKDRELFKNEGRKAFELIACRDYAPKIYMRLGLWDNARDFIFACMKANAYYPKRGVEELAYLEKYKVTAEFTVEYIRANPGILQKDIYKAIGGVVLDKDILKQFIRWSHLIRKEPYGKTNKLYVADPVLYV